MHVLTSLWLDRILPLSNMSTTSPTFEVAYPPFNDTGADIVLRSSDNVDFDVHKWPLSRASAIFKDMFSIPSTDDPSNLQDGLPVVCMTEDRRTLDIVLRLCYPIDKPNSTLSIPSVWRLIAAFDKYEMLENFSQTAESMLLVIAAKHPFVAYTIACRYQLLRTANRVALVSLQKPLSPEDLTKNDLESITAFQYNQLLLYHQRSSRAAAQATLPCAKQICFDHEAPVELLTYCTCSPTVWFDKYEEEYRPSKYAMQYLKSCETALESAPHWHTVLDDSLISALELSGPCCSCQSSVLAIREFSSMLEKRIKSVIENVSRAHGCRVLAR